MEQKELTPRLHGLAVAIGEIVGYRLEDTFPSPNPSLYGAIPADAVDALAEFWVVAIAESFQAWLDAGSEREVTFEDQELREGIRHAVKEWIPEEAEL